MDAYDATKIVFSRIQSLDPENATKIIGFLLIQDHGEKEMIRLAFGPESLLQSVVFNARRNLGLLPPSPTAAPPAPAPPQSNPFDLARQNSSSRLLARPPPVAVSFSPWAQPSPLSRTTDEIHAGGGEELIEEIHQLGGTGELIYPEECWSPEAPEIFPYGMGWGAAAKSGAQRQGLSSFLDVAGLGTDPIGACPDPIGLGWKPCLYFARGYCKNGSSCRYLHGLACHAATLGKMEGVVDRELLLRSKSQRYMTSFPNSPTGPLPHSPSTATGKCMNYLVQQQLLQNESQRVVATAAHGQPARSPSIPAPMEADDMEMAPEADMDTGENSAAAAGASAKRLAIKNTIHTNFGEDYVFQIASNPEISTLAVSLSTNTIKLYSPATGQFLGECRGHRGTIHEISFAVLSSPNLLCSCSSDATVRMWDTRNFKQVSLVKAGSYQEVFSFCIGGSSGNLLAGGCNSQIIFWDWRNSKQVACLEESHMADVTQVRFTPSQQNKLISSSVDGLLCLFDTDGHIDDDNHLECVMNVGTSIGKFGFFGEMNQKLWCLTHIETLSIWNWRDGRREINFEDARTSASDKWNLDNIDYFVDCYYSETEEKLWVLGGTGTGTLGYFPVNCNAPGMISFPEAILDGGHAGVVRTVLPVSMHHGIFPRSKGIFGWSGGEDGRLCCWLSDENLAANRSWINSNLVMKSTKACSKSRHRPY